MQGKIGEVKSKNGIIREIHVYINSSDFPACNIISMPSIEVTNTERVPITEEIWQRVGECLGYKFKRSENKDIK